MTKNRLAFYRVLLVWTMLLTLHWHCSQSFAGESKEAQQLSSSDWPHVIKTYETQIYENGATTEALHNLAFARFQNGEIPQAIAVWLAAFQKSPADKDVQAGMKGALRARGFDMDILDLSAQGPWLKFVANSGSHGFFLAVKASVAFTIVVLFLLGFYFFKASLNDLETSSLKSKLKIIVPWVVSLVAVSWIFIYFWHASLGQWGAVITPESTVLYERADEKSMVVQHLKSGLPIYIVGDTRALWLEAYNADGFHGWVRSIDVRIVRIMR